MCSKIVYNRLDFGVAKWYTKVKINSVAKRYTKEGVNMDYRFVERIKELQRTCPPEWAVYITTPHEMPGAAPADELAVTDSVLGKIGDDVHALYKKWEG